MKQYGVAFLLVILLAWTAFEVFNYASTEYALGGFLGGNKTLGVSWSVLLALAFCGIDFAGLGRLFTNQSNAWYLFGAWLMAATMNAMLTWWAVVETMLQSNAGNAVLGIEALLRVVPIFLAIAVWLVRVLLMSTLLGSDAVWQGLKTKTQSIGSSTSGIGAALLASGKGRSARRPSTPTTSPSAAP